MCTSNINGRRAAMQKGVLHRGGRP